MFAIYRKNVGGRIHDRYFKSYEKAKEELLRDEERMCKLFAGEVTMRKRVDRMNQDKGFYEFEVRMTVNTGTICEQASLAIVDGYFED